MIDYRKKISELEKKVAELDSRLRQLAPQATFNQVSGSAGTAIADTRSRRIIARITEVFGATLVVNGTNYPRINYSWEEVAYDRVYGIFRTGIQGSEKGYRNLRHVRQDLDTDTDGSDSFLEVEDVVEIFQVDWMDKTFWFTNGMRWNCQKVVTAVDCVDDVIVETFKYFYGFFIVSDTACV